MKISQIAGTLTILFMFLLSCFTRCSCDSIDKPDIPEPPAVCPLKLSSNGITWYFDAEYEHGTFANGDHWIKGPVNIIFIDPPSYTFKGWTRNGSMINPSPKLGSTQGYDSEMYAWHTEYGKIYNTDYDSKLNVSPGVSPGSPLVITPHSSLVSCISRDRCSRPQLKSAAILTVVETAPDGNDYFRPPYCGTDKTPLHRISMLRTGLLLNLNAVKNTPDIKDVIRMFERPWIDHVPNWSGRYIHPEENMPDYGREISTNIGIGALALHLNISSEDKMQLLVRYVQLGIDLYGIVLDGGENNWPPNGGHESGRKWPILFAGIILDDPGMEGIGLTDVQFGEDGQTFYVSQAEINITHDDTWNPDDRADELTPYETSDTGLAEWGITHSTAPEHDNKAWSATYRQCCTANSWAGFVLAARLMNAIDLWNHDALFDYQDRYMQITAPGGEHPGWRCTSDFVKNMWDTYRAGN